MRLMYTTALASAVMFAGPALAAGDKVEGTTGMASPEAHAAQLPGHGQVDAGILEQNFAGAGFSDWRAASDAQIFRMEHQGQPVWVVLMPDGFEVGGLDIDTMGPEPGDLAEGPDVETMDREPGDLAEAPGASLEQDGLPDVAEGPEATDMPQRGEQADVGETFEGADQPDIAEAPDLGEPGEADIAEAPDMAEPGEQPDIAEAPDLGEPGEPDVAETPDIGELGEPDVAETPDIGELGEPDVAEAPDLGEPGIVGEAEPEAFAAEIPGELRTDLEGAGFQQIESVNGQVFHATLNGQTAFIIAGDLAEAGFGFDQERLPGETGQPAPGAAPDMPEPSPGTEPSPGLPQ
jgi:hypothetical protein